MRGQRFRWRLRTDEIPDLPILDRILAVRGFTDRDAINTFVSPSLRHLHDPASLPGIETAVPRLLDAIKRGESIVIYGDYDVDGICAASILYHTLKTISPDANVRTYVPHRMSEGYGLNEDAMTTLADEGADVIVSVDCGITAVAPAARARSLGVDLIITDHHNPPATGDAMPDAFALVHPRLPGAHDAYPCGELCGAGVAFKLAWRLATAHCRSEKVSDELRRTLLDALVLAALGTIADVVPLQDENRTIASFGLKMVRGTQILGLNALIEAAGLTNADEIDAEAVGFRIAPRLNACGRMGHAQEAMELLTTADAAKATKIARRLNKQNEERQAVEREIFDQAAKMAEQAGMTGTDRRAIVLAHPDWHTGVVGIVCSRLVERFGRPAILLQDVDGELKGSARSIDGYSIHAGLVAASAHLSRFGGHDMAAGLALDASRFDAFVESLLAHAHEHIEPHMLTPEIRIDTPAGVEELDSAVVGAILRLGPFGRGHAKPVLMLKDVRITRPPRCIGSQAKHLEMTVRQETYPDRELRLVGWNLGRFCEDLAAGMHLDVVIRPTLNTWRGVTTVQGELRDFAKVESAVTI